MYTFEVHNFKLIGQLIVSNIEKLILAICEAIRIIHINRCTSAYSNKMRKKKYLLAKDTSCILV
jgi:hypothetical protein